MKSTERFSNRVDDYRAFRPGYPAAVTDLMRDTCSLKPGAPVADIGSGTGIFTKLLLEAGFDVTAVEPNEAMRLAAEEDLKIFPHFHSVAAPAEDTRLPAASFDAITVAQAFHWFDRAAARSEFQRLIRPGGWVFIIRNHRLADTSPFARDYELLLRSLVADYKLIGHRDEASESRTRVRFFHPGTMCVEKFDNPQPLDWPGLRGRYLSSSYVPAKGDPGHEEYLLRLEEIFHKNAVHDHVVFEQTTEVHYGKLS